MWCVEFFSIFFWCRDLVFQKIQEVAFQLLTSLSTNLKVKWQLQLYHLQCFNGHWSGICSLYLYHQIFQGLHHLSLILEFWVVIPYCPCWPDLALPKSTKVTPSWQVFLPYYPITTHILQESPNFVLLHLQEAFTELFLCSNEIIPTIRLQHSHISMSSKKLSLTHDKGVCIN